MNVHVASLVQSGESQTEEFLGDVVTGLNAQPKHLSPKYFYDAAGSELFEAITRLPEYYPTRTELGIFDAYGPDIAKLIAPGSALIEFGAGATTKIRRLLRHATIATYIPVDISGEYLAREAEEIHRDFPDLAVEPIVADFTKPFTLPAVIHDRPKAGFFPGSTIGNFEPHEASQFLRRARTLLGDDSVLIVGVDLEKDDRTLHAAYNDAQGVTARFNLNLLLRINHELGGNFDPSTFVHRAIYNRDKHRIEMHLVSRKAQSVRIAGRSFNFRMGESIHTENSYKYSVERFTAFARGAGWEPLKTWTDDNAMFSVHALHAAGRLVDDDRL